MPDTTQDLKHQCKALGIPHTRLRTYWPDDLGDYVEVWSDDHPNGWDAHVSLHVSGRSESKRNANAAAKVAYLRSVLGRECKRRIEAIERCPWAVGQVVAEQLRTLRRKLATLEG